MRFKRSSEELISWNMSILMVIWLVVYLCTWTKASFYNTDKMNHCSAEEKQDHLINSLGEFDITYPTELDHRGQVTNHVTTLSSHRRRRRSVTEEAGPIIYQVQFKGKTIKLILTVNTKLFGSGFIIERYKEDGTIERKTATDVHCYLVGETESFHTSVAISDCDGLAGIIDLGNDTIYIEPVLNTSLIVHRGWTRPGRPHLVYRKAVLERKEKHNLEFDELRMEDYPTGLKVDGESSHDAAARIESSYITMNNYADRAIKLYFVDEGKESFFQLLERGEWQNVDTFTSHNWVARDFDSGKQLFINSKKTYTPPHGTSLRRRGHANVTIPPGLKLPAATKPADPNSHITFINKSNRFVRLYYIEEGETIFFYNLSPGQEMAVNTYSSHIWFVRDLDTSKQLLVNGHKEYSPKKSDISHRIRVFITVPSS